MWSRLLIQANPDATCLPTSVTDPPTTEPNSPTEAEDTTGPVAGMIGVTDTVRMVVMVVVVELAEGNGHNYLSSLYYIQHTIQYTGVLRAD